MSFVKRLVLPWAAGVAVAAATTGCNWKNLDEAVERAPVLSVGAPSGYSASDVGRLIVALPPPDDNPAVSARFLVAATSRTSLALVDIDGQGKATTHNVPGAVLSPLAGQTFTSLALEPARPDQPHPAVLLGTGFQKDTNGFYQGAVWRLHVEPGPTFRVDPPLLPSPTLFAPPNRDHHFGRGVALGEVSGNPALPEWVVVSDFGVSLIEDGLLTVPAVVTPPMECGVAADAIVVDRLYQNGRNPVIGDFVPGLPGGEIAVGVTRNTGGAVVVLSRTATGLGCPMSLAGAEPSFGTSVASGDVNADGALDIVVGAPAAPTPRVYVFFGPFDPAVPAAPAVTIAAPAGAENAMFGARLTLVDLDGQPGSEIAVAAPKFAAGGTSEAGAVFLFSGNGTQLPVVVADTDPEPQGGLGEGLAAVTFRNARCAAGAVQPLLVAGANEEVFTYFRLPGALPDPRCYPQ